MVSYQLMLPADAHRRFARCAQAHHENLQVRSAQAELIADSTVQIHETKETIRDQLQATVEEHEAVQRAAYTLAKKQRTAQVMADTKLGYLQWKAGWWEREYDRCDARVRTSGIRTIATASGAVASGAIVSAAIASSALASSAPRSHPDQRPPGS